MSVEIDPTELGFHRTCSQLRINIKTTQSLIVLGPFTMEVTQILKIKNTNQNPVAFKVRSAEPICVTPLEQS